MIRSEERTQALGRAALAILVLGALGTGIWTAAFLCAADTPGSKARPSRPRVEEEEDGPPPAPGTKSTSKPGKSRVEEEEAPGAPRKVRRVEEEDIPDDPADQVASGDLRQAAAKEKNPIVRQLFHELSVPHDLAIFKYVSRVISERGQQEEYIEPFPEYCGDGTDGLHGSVTFHPLDPREWTRLKEYNPTRHRVGSIQPYEDIAVDRVEKFLAKKLDGYPAEDARFLTRYKQLQKAEQALAAVLRFHESARPRNVRRGDGWDAVQGRLRQLLLKVMLEELARLREAEDWDGLNSMTRRLAATYVRPEERKLIAVPLAEEVKRILSSNSPIISEDRRREALARLHYLEEQFPANPVVQELSRGLQSKAQALLDEARELARGPEGRDAAQQRLHQAEELWPSLPGLQAYKIELGQKHPVLRVGMRQLPVHLSPALAWTTNELRVVEMLFEGLMKQSPDNSGQLRYQPALADGMPRVVPLGREFQLPREARWSQDQVLDAGDVRFTVRQMRKGHATGRNLVWGEMLEEVELRGHAHQVTLHLRHAYLDPLALMTFKIVPQHSSPDSKEFAEHPLGSGPFLFAGRGSEDGRRFLRLKANPYYGSRLSKRDRPYLQEIRLFSYSDAVEELRNNRLDLVLDLNAAEAAALVKEEARHRVRVLLPGPTTVNRRVYFLAVNQRKAPLNDKKVRQSLALAINRETILDHHYRGELQRSIHKALNGPFPVSAWARDPELGSHRDAGSLDPCDPALAQARSKEIADLIQHSPELTLKYPEDDGVLKSALEELVKQVQQETGIRLRLVPRDPLGLREDVEQTQSYDLAYYHYDFPDQTYWLRPLFGPNTQEGTENILGFQAGKAQTLFEELRGLRYFPKVQETMRLTHKLLLEEMPIIPLWQLDPLAAIHEEVQAPPFDPLLVFTDSELWKLLRK